MPVHDSPRVWRPRRLLVTRAARGFAHGRAMMERAGALGVEVVELAGDRLALDLPDDPARAYAEAKRTLAVVAAPPSKRRFQPIPPSADWRIDLAQGCPAHCAYCYLAGSLAGPPITRAYANLDEIVAAIPGHVGAGTITSRSTARAHEGTTFEASCYTDPLAIEGITGSLAALVAWFGDTNLNASLRFTSKFANVEPLLDLAHRGRTRMRVSLNPAAYARFEGGTARVANRLRAMRRMADAGYPIGLTIAPIIAAEGWREAYGGLITDVAVALEGTSATDLTVELITHRYTDASKAVLDSWYPGSALDMTGADRMEKRTKFGTSKQVYDAATMRVLKAFFYDTIARELPGAKVLYWT